jgi:enoyl-CoA hydratase/carnithine racemase
MASQDIILYEAKGGYATITLNRPPVHAFNLELMKGLNDALEKADKDDNAKCILLKSTGTRVFSAGIDIKSKSLDENVEYFNELKNYGRLNNQKMLLMKKPIVVQVQGSAIGYGMEILMACDLKLFADIPFPDMFFRMPEIALAIYPQTGATILPLLNFGLSYAKNILFTSDEFGLEQLKNLNIPTRIFPSNELEIETKKFMRTFSKRMDSFMYLIKSTLTLMNNKFIERWFDLEDECGSEAYKKKSQQEWEDFIRKLYKKYP